MKVRSQYQLPKDFQGCHTAVIDGYFFEGHIPAEDIKRFLQEKPKGMIGLSVPGMPMGSPGMEQGKAHEAYRVYYFKDDGNIGIWANH